MTEIFVTTRDGLVHAIDATAAATVMEAIRDAGIDEIQALCGGCQSCATCHVQIDPIDFDGLPPMTEDEHDLLESSDHRTATSRLSCQLRIGDIHAGLRLTIAPDG